MTERPKGRKLLLVLVGVGGAGLLVIVGLGLASGGVAGLMRSYLFDAFEMAGPSMAPGYIEGDRVVVDKLDAAPKLGQVVVLKNPDEGFDQIKRVVGLPGDTIAIRDGQLVRNGEPVPTEPAARHDDAVCLEEDLGPVTYRIKASPPGPAGDHGPVTLGDGRFFVLGDHRSRSQDSRAFGAVEGSLITGVVKGHYWRAEPRDPCEAPDDGDE